MRSRWNLWGLGVLCLAVVVAFPLESQAWPGGRRGGGGGGAVRGGGGFNAGGGGYRSGGQPSFNRPQSGFNGNFNQGNFNQGNLNRGNVNPGNLNPGNFNAGNPGRPTGGFSNNDPGPRDGFRGGNGFGPGNIANTPGQLGLGQNGLRNFPGQGPINLPPRDGLNPVAGNNIGPVDNPYVRPGDNPGLNDGRLNGDRVNGNVVDGNRVDGNRIDGNRVNNRVDVNRVDGNRVNAGNRIGNTNINNNVWNGGTHISATGQQVQVNVNRQFAGNPPFTSSWYRAHPSAWNVAHPHADAWAVASWGAMSSWLGVQAVPVVWPVNTSPTYVENNTYVESGPASSYSSETAWNLAYPEEDVNSSALPQDGWLTLGVYALAPISADQATRTVQLNLHKSGLLSGTYFDLLTNSAVPVQGTSNIATQQFGLRIGDNQDMVLSGTLGGLTQPESAVWLETSPEQKSQWRMVRLEDPQSGAQPQGSQTQSPD